MSPRREQREEEQPALLERTSILEQLPSSAAGLLPAGAAQNLPVAQVLLESSVPHLDRPFDYAVPSDLDERIVPGCRVKVRFSGRDMAGYVLSRSQRPTTAARLSLISSVVSSLPLLSPEILHTAEQVAKRYAGVTSDVLRAAIPSRVARVEKEYAQVEAPIPAEPAQQAGERAAALALKSFGQHSWATQIVEAVRGAADRGQAVVVVPDQRDVAVAAAALEEAFGDEAVARLTAELGPTPRFRNFLRLRYGQAQVAVGTRSAIFAPVPQLGLIVILDDDDPSHLEPRAPYHHVSDVALLRAVQTGAGMLFLSAHRSLAVQRLVERGWLEDHAPDREVRRGASPHMVATADSFQQERNGFGAARLPAAAYQAARDGLKHGPVLVQVGRSGFVPAVLCERCRSRQRCPHCHGPLSLPPHHQQSQQLQCRWCGLHHRRHRCHECGGESFRAGARGADRTAQELGRAFPHIPVVSSTSDHPVEQVGENPALVVATVGMEPLAVDGYTVALLLDGDSQLNREGLDVPGRVLAQWFRAASLVRPSDEGGTAQSGGTVVVTANHQVLTDALVRWDPVGYARRELYERLELGLPPAKRMLSLTGEPQQAQRLVEQAQLPQGLEWIGPATVEAQQRWLLFFTYGQADAVLTEMRRLRRSASAAPTTGTRSADHRAVRIAVDDLPALQF